MAKKYFAAPIKIEIKSLRNYAIIGKFKIREITQIE